MDAKLTLFAVASILAIAACARSAGPLPSIPKGTCAESGVTFDGQSIAICGKIESDTYYQVEKVLTEHDVVSAYVSSRGGNGVSTALIADLLDEYQLDVLVFGECMSSCMDFVFLVDRVSIAPSTALALHHTAASLGQIDRTSLVENLKPYLEDVVMPEYWRSRFELVMYQRHEVEAWHLTMAMNYLGLECTSEVVIRNGVLLGARSRRVYTYWLPSRELVEQARGKPIGGWWPEDLDAWYQTLAIPRTQLNFVLEINEVGPVYVPFCKNAVIDIK